MQYMSNHPSSIASLIDEWKTIAEFATDVGCGYEAARQMRRRDSIAPEHWTRVIAASKAKGIVGVSYEWLAAQRSSFDAAKSLNTPSKASAGVSVNPNFKDPAEASA